MYPGAGIQQELSAPPPDFRPLDIMFDVAVYAHGGKLRDTGDPYIVHPLEVCGEMGKAGWNEIAAHVSALGHDTIEETENWPEGQRITVEEIKKRFTAEDLQKMGEEVAGLIDGLTKIRKWGRSQAARQVQSLMKLIGLTKQDPRVMIIKLFDRLCNSRTYGEIEEEKARRNAQETLDIFVPFAKGLGMWEIRCELMENSFAVLYPNELGRVKKYVQGTIDAQKNAIDDARARLADIFGRENVRFVPKPIAEIFEEYLRQKEEDPAREVDLEVLAKGIHSFVAVRENDKDCYCALKPLHAPASGFIPVPETLVDHIANPTAGRYEALHTIVVAPNLGNVMVKIMTRSMEKLSRLGALSFYNPTDPLWFKTIIVSYPWLGQLVDDLRNRGKMTEQDIREATQGAASTIQVYTPKGKPLKVQFDSTALDFAYSVHKEIGLQATAARVVRRRRAFIAELDFKLEPGDQVEIITDPGHYPTFHDLDRVHTALAKKALRAYLRSRPRIASQSEGAQALLSEIERAKLHLAFEDLSRPGFRPFLRSLLAISPAKPKTLGEVAYLIGIGEMTPRLVIDHLKKYLERQNRRARQGRENGEIIQLVFEQPNRPGILAAISTPLAELGLDIQGLKVRYRKGKDSAKIARITIDVEVFGTIHKLQLKSIVRQVGASILSSPDDQGGNP